MTKQKRETSRRPKKKALLVGINKYKIPGADLRGCVNDVDGIEAVIKDFYGFSGTNIKRLVDLKATTKRMRIEWESLVDGAIPGDVLYFHFSGHGSNVPDKNGDEPDHRDEILCPADLDWYDPFLDDQIGAGIATLPDGVNLTLVFDCCHSGTLNRYLVPPDSKEPKERYLPCPLDLMAAESGRNLMGDPRGLQSRSRGIQFGNKNSNDIMVLDTPEVFLSGCRDDQTSADAYIGGNFQGVLTYHMIKAIKTNKGNVSYRQLHSSTTGGIKSSKFSQRPQLTGADENLNRNFLQPYRD